MLFAWISEDESVCATDELELVPPEYRERVVTFPQLELRNATKLVVRNGSIGLKSAEEEKQEKVEAALRQLRLERNIRLQQADWVFIRAMERGEPVPPEWRAYRQALRDLPQTLTEEQLLSGDIPWPTPPDA